MMMRAIGKNKSSLKGQSAIEYMLLLGVVVAIVLVGFKTYFPRSSNAAEGYFNTIAVRIAGPPHP